jgi:hypothetical protein
MSRLLAETPPTRKPVNLYLQVDLMERLRAVCLESGEAKASPSRVIEQLLHGFLSKAEKKRGAA